MTVTINTSMKATEYSLPILLDKDDLLLPGNKSVRLALGDEDIDEDLPI
jgi:hypothetical protein